METVLAQCASDVIFKLMERFIVLNKQIICPKAWIDELLGLEQLFDGWIKSKDKLLQWFRLFERAIERCQQEKELKLEYRVQLPMRLHCIALLGRHIRLNEGDRAAPSLLKRRMDEFVTEVGAARIHEDIEGTRVGQLESLLVLYFEKENESLSSAQLLEVIERIANEFEFGLLASKLKSLKYKRILRPASNKTDSAKRQSSPNLKHPRRGMDQETDKQNTFFEPQSFQPRTDQNPVSPDKQDNPFFGRMKLEARTNKRENETDEREVAQPDRRHEELKKLMRISKSAGRSRVKSKLKLEPTADFGAQPAPTFADGSGVQKKRLTKKLSDEKRKAKKKHLDRKSASAGVPSSSSRRSLPFLPKNKLCTVHQTATPKPKKKRIKQLQSEHFASLLDETFLPDEQRLPPALLLLPASKSILRDARPPQIAHRAPHTKKPSVEEWSKDGSLEVIDDWDQKGILAKSTPSKYA